MPLLHHLSLLLSLSLSQCKPLHTEEVILLPSDQPSLPSLPSPLPDTPEEQHRVLFNLHSSPSTIQESLALLLASGDLEPGMRGYLSRYSSHRLDQQMRLVEKMQAAGPGWKASSLLRILRRAIRSKAGTWRP